MHGICTYDAIIHAFIKQNWPIRTIEYKSKSLSRSDAQRYIYMNVIIHMNCYIIKHHN